MGDTVRWTAGEIGGTGERRVEAADVRRELEAVWQAGQLPTIAGLDYGARARSARRGVPRLLACSASRTFDVRRLAVVGEGAHTSQSVGEIPGDRPFESARNCNQARGTPT